MSETNPNELNVNPYAPGVVQKKEILSEVEELRKRYLSHEASVKSVGILFVIGALIGIVSGGSLIAVLADPPPNANKLGMAATAACLILLGVAQIVVAFGIRKLKAWSRIPATLLSVIGLLAVPVGTIVNFYILYLLLSAKGAMVFSPQYKEVIAQTPHMKYKSSTAIWIALALIIVLMMVVVFAFAV